MKTNYFNILLIVIILVTMISCNEKDQLNNTNYKPDLVNQINYYDSVYVIGQLHNEFLDTMYARISRIKDSTDIFPEIQFDTYSKQQATMFFENKGYNIQTYVDTSNISDITLDEFLNADTTLSSAAKVLLQSLNIALNVYANNNNLTSFQNTCDSIINESSDLTDSVEQVVVSIGASIGKSSASFWTSSRIEQFDNLVESSNNILLISDIQKRILLTDKQKRIINKDIGAAIEGAIAGGIWGASVGQVAGAIAGAIAGGLIHGSVASLGSGILTELGIQLPWWLQWLL